MEETKTICDQKETSDGVLKDLYDINNVKYNKFQSN